MMTSKKQRLMVYKRASKTYQRTVDDGWNSYVPVGMCTHLKMAHEELGFGKLPDLDLTIGLRENFPEFWSFKPKIVYKSNPSYWWTPHTDKAKLRRLETLKKLAKGETGWRKLP